MDIEIFSSRLSSCMKAKNLSGVELASISGVTEATISRYLNGMRTPSSENLILLANALNVSTDYLLGLHNVPDDKILIRLYENASCGDKKVIWTLLEKYGGTT